MKIYLAGPDVFRPDLLAWAESARATCIRYGHEPLIPIDHGETAAPRIFQANLDMIRKAEMVVANLNPFRGAEPDSGTCFELGFAMALDKKICGYVERMETLLSRVNRIEGGDLLRSHDNRGMTIENFNLPLNLMLAVPTRIIEGGLEDCFRELCKRTDEAAGLAIHLPDNPVARQAIEAAIRYLRWVADGKISDDNAVATVAEQYKVKVEIVREWLAIRPNVSLASQADYRPGDVVRLMKISGRQFRGLR